MEPLEEIRVKRGPSGWRKFFTASYWAMMLRFGRPLNIVEVVQVSVDPGSDLGKRLRGASE